MSIFKSVSSLAVAVAALLATSSSALTFDATLQCTAAATDGTRSCAVSYDEPGFMNGTFFTEGCDPTTMSCDYDQAATPTSSQLSGLLYAGVLSRTSSNVADSCLSYSGGFSCLVHGSASSFLADCTQASTGQTTCVNHDLIDDFTIDVDDTGTKYCCTQCGPLGCQGCSEKGLGSCSIILSCEPDGPWFCDP